MSSPESKKYCVSLIVRIVLLLFATISLITCTRSDDSVASYNIVGPVHVGVFTAEYTTGGLLSLTLEESLMAFLDDSEKAGWVCDGAKPLARAMEAFAVLSTICCAFLLCFVVSTLLRDLWLLDLSLVLGVATSVFQTITIALWVAFRHIKCTVGGTPQPRFPDGSDTYGIVLMSISLVFIVASVPLGVFSRTMHKEAFSYVSIQ